MGKTIVIESFPEQSFLAQVPRQQNRTEVFIKSGACSATSVKTDNSPIAFRDADDLTIDRIILFREYVKTNIRLKRCALKSHKQLLYHFSRENRSRAVSLFHSRIEYSRSDNFPDLAVFHAGQAAGSDFFSKDLSCWMSGRALPGSDLSSFFI